MKKVTFITRTHIHFLDPNEVAFIQAKGAYSLLVLTSGEKIKLSHNMKNIIAMFGNYNFIKKVHRSFSVNLLHVNNVQMIDKKLYAQVSEEYNIPITLYSRYSFLEFVNKMGALNFVEKKSYKAVTT